jgi:hypothetical protein
LSSGDRLLRADWASPTARVLTMGQPGVQMGDADL